MHRQPVEGGREGGQDGTDVLGFIKSSKAAMCQLIKMANVCDRHANVADTGRRCCCCWR